MISQDRHRGCVEWHFRGKDHFEASDLPSPVGLRWTIRWTSPVLALSVCPGVAAESFGAVVSGMGDTPAVGLRAEFCRGFCPVCPRGGVSLFHVWGLFGGRDVVVEQGWKVPLVDVGAHHAVDHVHRYQPVGWLDEFAEEVLPILDRVRCFLHFQVVGVYLWAVSDWGEDFGPALVRAVPDVEEESGLAAWGAH